MSTTLARGSGNGPVLGQEQPEVIASDEKLRFGCFISFGTKKITRYIITKLNDKNVDQKQIYNKYHFEHN